jgi:hypothetical protein
VEAIGKPVLHKVPDAVTPSRGRMEDVRWLGSKNKKNFVCATCGRTHAGPVTDYGFQLPDVVWEQPAEERQRHLDWSTDICFFNGRWYLRGLLEVPIRCEPWRFGWGVWAEVSEQVMAVHAAHHRDGNPQTAAELGTMANAIPAYPDAFDLPLEISFGNADMRPLFTCAQRSEHLLAVEQREGITEARYHEILSLIA